MTDHLDTDAVELDSKTDFNLLDSLVRGDADSEAWGLFIKKYQHILFRWSVRWGAANDETDEVFQETLLNIHQCLANYQKLPDTHFRAWLKTLAYRSWLQILNRRPREQTLPASHVFHLRANDFQSPLAREDLIAQFDHMAELEILHFACRNVASSVEPQTWECFRLTYFEEVPGEVVAERLGVTVNAVYLSNGRLRRLLRQEIERFDTPEN